MVQLRSARPIALAGLLSVTLATAGCSSSDTMNEPVGWPMQRIDPVTKLALYEMYPPAQDRPSDAALVTGVEGQAPHVAER